MRLSRRRFVQSATAGALSPAGPVLAQTRAIDQTGFVRIGGIDQWLAIQGRDVDNPVILYLHGGPGEAQSPFLKEFLPWETDFTVVNWDQRGAGKTFGRNGAATPDMTLDQLIADAGEVAEYVSNRLSKPKVILVGQSWGTILGVSVIKRRPTLFHAYVGTGQVAGFAATAAEQASWARAEATRAGDKATLAALDKAASLPQPSKSSAEAKASRKYLVAPSDRAYAKMIQDFMGPDPQAARGDAADWIAGAAFSGSKLGQVIVSMELANLGLDMPIPFFVFQGREDHIVGFRAAKDYAGEIRAPKKEFVAIDGGHYACFTSADQFLAALHKYVRPLAV